MRRTASLSWSNDAADPTQAAHYVTSHYCLHAQPGQLVEASPQQLPSTQRLRQSTTEYRFRQHDGTCNRLSFLPLLSGPDPRLITKNLSADAKDLKSPGLVTYM